VTWAEQLRAMRATDLLRTSVPRIDHDRLRRRAHRGVALRLVRAVGLAAVAAIALFVAGAQLPVAVAGEPGGDATDGPVGVWKSDAGDLLAVWLASSDEDDVYAFITTVNCLVGRSWRAPPDVQAFGFAGAILEQADDEYLLSHVTLNGQNGFCEGTDNFDGSDVEALLPSTAPMSLDRGTGRLRYGQATYQRIDTDPDFFVEATVGSHPEAWLYLYDSDGTRRCLAGC
jgi:hypothetical protein